jgi:hypothetical protein
MKDRLKTDSLIPFLNQKHKCDLKFNKDSLIERKETIINKCQTINENDLTVMCIISTQSPDRVGDVVISNGIKTEEFKKINSVYCNHDYSLLPIGTCEELIHKDGVIEAKVKFIKDDELSMKLFNQLKNGVRLGASIGFEADDVVLKGTMAFDNICKSLGMDVDSYQKTNRIIKSWMMFEFSLCGLPANANCMTKSAEPIEVKNNDEADKTDEVKKEAEVTDTDKDDKDDKESPKEEAKEEAKEEVKELSEGAKVESEEHSDVAKYLKEQGIDSSVIGNIFEMIASAHTKEDPDYYKKNEEPKEEAKEEAKEEVKEDVLVTHPLKEEAPIVTKKIVIIPQVKRFIQVIKTPEDDINYIKTCVDARIKGKTRVVIV